MEYNSIMEYNKFIDPKTAFQCIEEQWKKWADKNNACTYVVGISGGVDSTCAAALAAKLFGKNNVIGVSLPCDGQKDMDDVNAVFAHLGIRRITIDIGDVFYGLKCSIENQGLEVTEQCTTNMPARLRMVTLYGIAQCFGAFVLNTCQRSESVVGYDTLFGDSCGDFAPIKNLVKSEVQELAAWLGVPSNLAYKTPIDGLQPLTDEQKFGFSYKELDRFIRNAGEVDKQTADKIVHMHHRNKFKLEIINVPGPTFDFASDVFRSKLVA